MKTVSISKLKASLSAYIAQATSGEEVLVTDRGRPIARIVPARIEESMGRHLDDLARRGFLRPGHGTLPVDFWSVPLVQDPEGAAVKALLLEREESR